MGSYENFAKYSGSIENYYYICSSNPIIMKSDITIPLLKEYLQFTIEVIDFCDYLTKQKKDVIANKLLDAAIGVSSTLQSCKLVERESDCAANLKKVKKNMEEVNYWLGQCHKSENYHHNQELLETGRALDKKLIDLLTKK